MRFFTATISWRQRRWRAVLSGLALLAAGVGVPARAAQAPQNAAYPIQPGWTIEIQGAQPLLVVGTTNVFAVHGRAKVVAYSLADGAVAWSRDFGPPIEPGAESPIGGPRVTWMSGADRRLYVYDGKGITALDEADGTRAYWRFEDGSEPVGARSGWLFTSTVSTRLVGRLLVPRTTLTARRAVEGTVVWRLHLDAPIIGSVAVDGGLAVALLANRQVIAVDLVSGKLTWTHDLPANGSQLLAGGDRVYVDCEDGFLYGYRPGHSRLEWSVHLLAPIVGALTIDDDHVYYTTLDNMVHAMDRVGAGPAWDFPLPGRSFPGLTVDSRVLVTPLATGELKLISTREGKVAGSLPAVVVTAPNDAYILVAPVVSGGTGDAMSLIRLTMSNDFVRQKMTLYRRGTFAVTAADKAPGTALTLRPPKRP